MSIAPSGDFYLRWNINTGGSNSQGIGIDNVSVTATFAPVGTNTSAEFDAASSSIAENAGPATLDINITNEGPTATDTAYVYVSATGALGRISGFTAVVKVPGDQNTGSVSVSLNNNSLCDGNQNVVFTIDSVTGGQGTPFVGGVDDHTLTINNEDVCTGVSYSVTSATVSEGVGTYNVTVNITDFSPSVATIVDVVLTSGNGARVNGFATQTVTFPANNGAAQTVTLTVTDNGSCDGTAVLNFGLENLAGGQGTPFVGPNSTRSLTIEDNDQSTDDLISESFETDGAGTRYTLSQAHFSGPSSGDFFLRGIASAFTGAGGISVGSPDGTNYMGGEDMDGGGGAPERIVTFNPVNANGYSNLSISLLVGSNNGANFDNNANADYLLVERRIDGGSWVTIGAFRSKANVGAANGRLALDADLSGVGDASPEIGSAFASFNFNIGATGDDLEVRIRFRSDASDEDIYFDNVELTGSRCSTIYYSRNDGNVGDAIWSDTPTGTAGIVSFSRFASMVVQNGDAVGINANTRVNDFTVATGGQVDLAANTLTVSGDVFSVDGTFTAADNSNVVLNSADLVTLESALAISLFDLTATTPDGVLTDATIAIRGTLQLNDGDFDASLGAITLSSTNSGTGRLGAVGSGASYTGDLTVQRYIPAGATNWRLLGSPVAGETVNEWRDDFYTAGFPGSHSPTFSNPVGSGILWPSVRWYDETKTFAAIDTGWVGVSSISQSLAQGQGFAAWCGTGLETTTAFTVDVTGAPYVANTPINVNLSYTNNGAPTVDGWNVVSNPLASPILFSNIARTNVDNYVWFYDPANGNTAVWDNGLELGTLGGTDTIQSSQAFLVKANAASAQLQFVEADKVARRTGGFFGGDQVNTFNGVRLKLTSGLNAFNDEAVVLFSTGTADLDANDVPKMTFAHPAAPQIATVAPTGEKITINAFGAFETSIAIPVVVDVAVTGNYTVTASDMANVGLTCIMLEDLLTGTMTPMTEGASYSFTVAADASATEPRLLLHASAPVPVTAQGVTCFGSTDGQGTIAHMGDAPIAITWSTSTGEAFLEQTIASGVAVANDLAAGSYLVSVSSNAGCGTLVTEFTIAGPEAMEALAALSSATCPDTEDGSIDLTVLGGTAPFTYAWSNSSTDEDLQAAPGSYSVVVTDANDCVLVAEAFTIEAGEAPVATATADATTTLVNMPVNFANTTTGAETFEWNFGDGTVSADVAPFHTWSLPGTYTVTLTVTNGTCSSTWSTDVVVETSTSITDAANSTALNAWFANDKFVVEHGFDNGQPVVIDVLDATGRLHTTRQAAGTPARINVPAERLSTGIWFLRISNNGTQRTLRVPLVR